MLYQTTVNTLLQRVEACLCTVQYTLQ